MFFIITCLLVSGNVMALEYGSMMGKSVQMYTQVTNAPVDTNYPAAGVTIDYKLVTAGGRAWAYIKMNGANVMADEWASQFRCWGAGFNLDDKQQENNLINRMTGNVSYGTNSKNLPTEKPFDVSFYQCATGYVFTETVRMSYNPDISNSVNANDKEAPVLTCSHELKNLTLNLTLSATDNSDNYFFYIEDAANNIEEVSLMGGSMPLPLAPSTTYDIKVYAIDFSGNESTAASIQLTTGTAIDVSDIISAYCTSQVGTTAEQYAYITMETDNDGKIIMSIDPYEGDASATTFRNNGYNDTRVAAITVNGDANAGYKYLTRTINAEKTQIIFTPVAGKVNPGDEIIFNQPLEYKTPKNTNLYPTYKFTYIYGTNCSKATLVSTSVNSIKFNPYNGVQKFTVSGVNLTGDLTVEAPKGLDVSPKTITPDVDGNANQLVTVTWAEGSSNGTIKISGGGLLSPKTVGVVTEDFSEYCNQMISQSDNGTNPAYMTISLSEDSKEMMFDIAPVTGQLATWNNNSIPDTKIYLNGNAATVTRTKTDSRITIAFEQPLATGDRVTFGNPLAWTLKQEDGTNINANVYTNTEKIYTVGLGCELAENVTPPVIASATVDAGSITASRARINVTVTEGDFPVAQISLREDDGKVADMLLAKSNDDFYSLSGLASETPYSFSVTAIDTKGIESDPVSLEFTTKEPAGFESVSSGVAQGLEFELSNEGTIIKVKARLTNGKGIVDASFKVVKQGGTFPAEDTDPGAFKLATQSWGDGLLSIEKEFDLAVNNVAAVGDIIAVRFGYLEGPVAEGNWDAYGNYKPNIDHTDKGEEILYKLDGTVGIENASSEQLFSIAQNAGMIQINAENEIEAVQLYAIDGQLIAVSAIGEINTTALNKGIYILTIKDVNGNAATFKVAVK